MHESSFFEETGPCITRRAFGQALAAHPWFAQREWAVDFGTHAGDVIPSGDKNAASIEFIVTVWHDEPNLDYWAYHQAMNDVHAALADRYGCVVAGKQPVADPDWHYLENRGPVATPTLR